MPAFGAGIRAFFMEMTTIHDPYIPGFMVLFSALFPHYS